MEIHDLFTLKNKLFFINIANGAHLNLLIWCIVLSIPTFLILLYIKNKNVKKVDWKWSYLFKHWFGTLLISSLLFSLFQFISEPYHSDILGEIIFYLFFSTIFSLPVFAIYTLLFIILNQLNTPTPIAKIILISTTIIGVFVTNYVIWKTSGIIMEIFYALTALLIGIFLKLEKPSTTH